MAKRPPAHRKNSPEAVLPASVERRAYVEIDLPWLEETGEIRVISQPMIAPTVTHEVPKGSFEIVYTSTLFDVLKKLGNKKMEVFSYLLENKDGLNSLNTTNSELAVKVGCSRPTVVQTMKVLEDAGLITRKNSVVYVTPALMVKGGIQKEGYIMQIFKSILEQSIAAKQIAKTATIDDQLCFDENCQIVERAH